MNIFFPPNRCVMKRDMFYVLNLSNDVSTMDVSTMDASTMAMYLASSGIPIRVHRWDSSGADDLWLLSDGSGGAWASLHHIHFADLMSVTPEPEISFRDESKIVIRPKLGGLQILWEGLRMRRGWNVIPLSDPRAGGLDGVIAVEGEEGLQAVLAFRVWRKRKIVLYKPWIDPQEFPLSEVPMNGVEIAYSEDMTLMSVVGHFEGSNMAALFILSKDRVSYLRHVNEKSPDHICAAFPIPAGAWDGLQVNGLGVILARAREDMTLSFTLQVFEGTFGKSSRGPVLEKTIVEGVRGTVPPRPNARVSPDRRFLAVELSHSLHIFSLA